MNILTFLSSIFERAVIDVGITGTFDVENYGDLLFPIIAEKQLKSRNRRIRVVSFSLNARSKEPWPYEVYSVNSLKDRIPELAGLLIGGGQIIRFDSSYPIFVDKKPNLSLDYWFNPANLALESHIPLIWNSPGAPVPLMVTAEYEKSLNQLLSKSSFIAVRDNVTKSSLMKVNNTADIKIIPDTVFSISKLWSHKNFSSEYILWRKNHGVDGDYVIIQADKYVSSHIIDIERIVNKHNIKNIVILPICKCHGDDSENISGIKNVNVTKSVFLDPILTSEVIANSRLVFASSLHACITAVSYGIPCIRFESFNSADRKFEILNEFDGVVNIEDVERVDKLSLDKIDSSVLKKKINQLEEYWDIVYSLLIK